MDQVEQEVEAAVRRFYDAIETMVSGGGVEALSEAWHHTDRVTARHPIDEWAVGWDEVWETWKSLLPFGRADRGGGQVMGLRTYVYGDIAYATVSFRAAPRWGGEKLMCTNVLLRKDGVWKIIHHHADPSPGMQAALERMVAEM
jgi:ketosteroid isomerase-like protein